MNSDASLSDVMEINAENFATGRATARACVCEESEESLWR
jgi:hypothetical protein